LRFWNNKLISSRSHGWSETGFLRENFVTASKFGKNPVSLSEPGAEHPDTAQILNNLAELYYAMGRYPEAEPLLVRSLTIRIQQLGADHPDTAGSLNNQAQLYRAMRRYPDAEPLYLEALKIFLNGLGENHPSTQTVWSNFIDCLREAISAGQDSQLSQHPTTQAVLQKLRETE
jgi:tetratricopeptide (TPR) repeat protein